MTAVVLEREGAAVRLFCCPPPGVGRPPGNPPIGLPVYTADFGSVSNLLGSRYPTFARLDLRMNWRPHGEPSRWLFYLEFINATGRDNVGQYEAKLRPVRGASEPRIEEVPTASLPFLPTFGIRFRF